MSGRLSGRTAIVTGAGSGIGTEIAKHLVREGASVVVADLDAERAAAVTASLDASGSVLAWTVDISDEGSVADLVAAADQTFGSIDILCNNAAITSHDHLSRDLDVINLELEVWRKTLEVNLTGTMLCCKHVIPLMIRGGRGSIINISSGASLAGDRVLTSYGISKVGVNLLTKSVATQYGHQGVRSNCLCLGPTITATSPEGVEAFVHSQYDPVLLTPYLGRGEDVAAAAVFLASDESRYITGQIISVDGGLLAHQPTVVFDPPAPAELPGT
jgi:NAD(P)-dependent dehydrogenase (short-subunit alcohol dehydrogenase family)